MSIQSNVNQSLSLAGLLAANSPTIKDFAERHAKLREIKTREKLLKKQYEQVGGKSRPRTEADTNIPKSLLIQSGTEVITQPPDISRAKKIQGKLAELKQEEFEVKPTEKTYSAAVASESGRIPGLDTSVYDEFNLNIQAENSRKKAQEAWEKIKAEQAAKRKSRRKFIDYIKDEPTSLGTTVGELDPRVQKEILKSYSRSERKAIMKAKDAAKETSGGTADVKK